MRYPILANEFCHEIEIRRSRFLATLAPADSVEDARAFIQGVRDTYPEANHNCWAYLVGPPGATDRVGMSDDGEPHGTAGRPMLHVLSHSEVGDVAVVVTRWFGGVKLGTGGLVRAYSDAVQQALELAPRAERVDRCEVTVEIDYAGVEPFRRLLPAHEAEVVEEQWGALAGFRVRLPREGLDAFTEAVRNMSNGTARITEH